MTGTDVLKRNMCPDELSAAIFNFCSKYNLIDPAKPLLVAVSGGADSVALLFLLQEIYPGLQLVVAHYNHRWRGSESDADECFVKALSARLNLPFVAGRASRDYSMTGQSEAEARADRYRFLREAARAWGRTAAGSLNQEPEAEAAPENTIPIALAHHRQDRAETVLLNLLRGSSVRGLTGIRPRQNDIVRPLLDIDPADLKNYLRERGEDWRHDSSNDVPGNKRNAVRLELIPFLARYSHGRIVDRILATAEAAAADDDCLEQYAAAFFEKLARYDFFLPWQSLVTDQPETGSIEIRAEHCFAGGALFQKKKAGETWPWQPVALHFPTADLSALPPAVLRRLIRRAYTLLVGDAVDLTAEQIIACEDRLRLISRDRQMDKKHSSSRASYDLRGGIFYSIDRSELTFAKTPPECFGLARLSSYRCGWDQKLLPVGPAAGQHIWGLKACITDFKDRDRRLESVRRTGFTEQKGLAGQDRKAMRAELSGVGTRSAERGLVLEFIDIEKEELLDYNCSLWACLSGHVEQITALRCRRPGDQFSLPNGRKRNLKKILNEASIPALWRDRLLFVTDGADLCGTLNMNLFGRFTENIKFFGLKHAKLVSKLSGN